MIPLTADDVENALDGSVLASDELPQLPSRAQKASDLVEGYIGLVYADGVTIPGVVTRVTAGCAARLYQRDRSKQNPGLFTDTMSGAMGPFNANIKFSQDVTSGDPWLTKADKTRLKNVFSGYRAMSMQSDRGCPFPLTEGS